MCIRLVERSGSKRTSVRDETVSYFTFNGKIDLKKSFALPTGFRLATLHPVSKRTGAGAVFAVFPQIPAHQVFAHEPDRSEARGNTRATATHTHPSHHSSYIIHVYSIGYQPQNNLGLVFTERFIAGVGRSREESGGLDRSTLKRREESGVLQALTEILPCVVRAGESVRVYEVRCKARGVVNLARADRQ